MSSRARRAGPRPVQDGSDDGGQAPQLDHAAAATVEDFIRGWEPLPAITTPPGEYLPVASLEEALEGAVASEWLLLLADQGDDERLRLRNALDEACTDERGKALIARDCEALAERCEAHIAALVDRLPDRLRSRALCDHLYNIVHVSAGLRLLRGIDPTGLDAQLLRCLQAGGLPCGWQGDWPDGRLMAFFRRDDGTTA